MRFFPNLLDGAVPGQLIRGCLAEWPEPTWPHWHRYDNAEQRKLASKAVDPMPPTASLLLAEMSLRSPPVAGAFPDLHLHAAGMSQMARGDFIGRHADAAGHPLRPYARVASSCLFLTECTGGELMIDGFPPIAPVPGRLVIFDGAAPHSVDRVRRGQRLSINLFWWRVDTGCRGCRRAQFS